MCWAIELFFQNSYLAVTKSNCPDTLNCSFETSKSMKIKASASKKEPFLITPLGCCFREYNEPGWKMLILSFSICISADIYILTNILEKFVLIVFIFPVARSLLIRFFIQNQSKNESKLDIVDKENIAGWKYQNWNNPAGNWLWTGKCQLGISVFLNTKQMISWEKFFSRLLSLRYIAKVVWRSDNIVWTIL